MAHWHQEIVESFLASPYDGFISRAADQKWQNEPMYIFITKLYQRGKFEIACAFAGIDDKTAYAWKNENDKVYHPEFVEVVKKGRALWAESKLSDLEEKGAESWQATAWLLERLAPDEYKEHKAAEVTSDNANVLTKLLTKIQRTNEPNQPTEQGASQTDNIDDV